MTGDLDSVVAMTDTPDLAAAMARLLAEIAGVRSEAPTCAPTSRLRRSSKGKPPRLKTFGVAYRRITRDWHLICGIGILFFVLLSGYFVTEDAYLESTISILTVLAWIAATTEALDLVLERYS
jgi:hypothetical protein